MAIMPQIAPSMLFQTMNPSPSPTAGNPVPPSAHAVADFKAAQDRNSAGMDGRNTVINNEITTLRALDVAVGSDGDAILGGLEHLRSVFNTQQASIANLMNGSVVDTNNLMALQVEAVKYSLLIDVTSKLSNRTAQAVSDLMKG